MTIETANRLYELRKKRGLSQEELAEKLGVSRQAVSKWERSEASPDTDNLIALAKLYGLSLDELIYGEKDNDSKSESESEEESAADNDKNEFNECEDNYINIDDGKDRVQIGPKGIFVESDDGEKVHISFGGIKIESSKSNDEESDEDDEADEDEYGIDDENARTYKTGDGKFTIKINQINSKPNTVKFWLSVPYPIICAIIYLWLGFTVPGAWGIHWVIFVTIPVYYSLVKAISKRRFSEFAYSTLVSCVFLYIGLCTGDWHPAWLVFLTIPIYYPIASIIDSGIKRIK